MITLDTTGYAARHSRINENSSTIKYSVYPNPTSGLFYIVQNVAFNQSVQIVVKDLLGKEVITKRDNFYNGRISIDVEQLVSGVYIVEMLDSKSVKSQFKFVKE